jgi:hypothetical protein
MNSTQHFFFQKYALKIQYTLPNMPADVTPHNSKPKSSTNKRVFYNNVCGIKKIFLLKLPKTKNQMKNSKKKIKKKPIKQSNKKYHLINYIFLPK